MHRVTSALLLASGLVLLLSWWGRATSDGRIGNVRVLDRAPGEEVVLSLLTVLEVEDGRHYRVGNSHLTIPVEGITSGLGAGMEVTVGGTVRDGYVQESWHEVATGRSGKKRLGLLGIGLAGLLAAGTLRWAPGGMAIRG